MSATDGPWSPRPDGDPAPSQVAVIIPCKDEAASIGRVVDDLRQALPGARVYVYDNGSTDATALTAARHGALVRSEKRPGKGNVVRRAFADIDADAYLLIDGDDTYDASCAPQLLAALAAGPHDHVVGVRRPDSATAYRPGHAKGNATLNRLVSAAFGTPVADMLSGYRVVSRRFAKSFPALSHGFEIETELTIHAVSLRVPQTEVCVGFRDRALGSESKLHTYRDGRRILALIARLAHDRRPLLVHGIAGGALVALGLVLGAPVVIDFAATGLVPRLPTAVLASSLVVLAALVVAVGVVLDAVRRARDEAARLAYLRYPAPRWTGILASTAPGAQPRPEPVTLPHTRVGDTPRHPPAAVPSPMLP